MPRPIDRGRRSAHVVVAAAILLVSSGCDKLKSAIGKDTDGGSSPSGGLLSFLGSDFEGEITVKMTNKTRPAEKSAPHQMVLGLKKPKYRVDMSAGAQATDDAGSFIIDLPSKKGYMLMHPKKMAMVIDFEAMKNMPKGQGIPGMARAPKGGPTAAPTQPPKVEKTGKKDVVAGYSCEIWNVTNEGKKAEICAAEGITWVDLSTVGMSSPEIALAAVTSEANRFPLRVVAYDVNGAEEMRMEATKVDKKKLDDAHFTVPSDYKVVDMSALMGGLPGLVPSGIPNFKPPPR